MEKVASEKVNKPVRLRRIFIRYLAVLCAATLLLMLILGGSFLVLLSRGIILPANYAESQLTATKEQIASSESVTAELIPELCRYAVYTNTGQVISGNLSSAEVKRAWNLTQRSEHGRDFARFYLKIVRKDEVCIVRYTLLAQFSSPVLRRFLPPPEILEFLIFVCGFLLEIFLLASSFGKLLTRKMSGIQGATEKILNQDLEFAVAASGVIEIDDVLFSLEKMKEALKISLKDQWNMDQMRREQISALAHDARTPLTVIRGNAELLAETTPLTEEQEQYISYLTDNAARLEQYVKGLLSLAQAESGTVFRREAIASEAYMKDLCGQISALVFTKGLQVICNTQDLPPSFSADPHLLRRCIMNVVSNAVEHSPVGGEICFSAQAKDDWLRFCVTDSGNGFSAEELTRATEQFYMGETSRSSKDHYGMGLYITKSIVKLHNGALALANDPDTGGGQVTIEIPISCCHYPTA